MKRMFVSTAIVLAMVIMVFTASAKADVSFVGIGATGTDVYGNTWVWNTTLPLGFALPNVSVWGIPGLGNGNATWTGPATNDFDIVFGTAFTLPGGVKIDFTPSTGGYDDQTRFVNMATGGLWTEVAVSPTEIEFFAPAGSQLVAGQQFFVNVAMTGLLTPAQIANIGFVASYSPVPVPPSVLLLAPGLLGLVGIRKRFKG
jgi:hypothetical protein